MRRHFIVAALVVLAAAHVAAQAADPTRLGPRVGERVPDFTLPDQQGVPRTLGAVLGPKGGVLVFFRSADW
jgi:cytochrome oxidase Cu insertion factor (SCO1/SenC/PrrC family)